MVSPVTPAPEPLEDVRQFVNTLDIETGQDEITDPAGLGGWFAEHNLDGPRAVTAVDLERAVDLREALREALAANHDRADVPADARGVINASAARADLTVEFTADRTRRTTSRERVADAAFGVRLGVAADAMADGTRVRLKVCANDLCRWAFYDNSRARTAKWCSMQVCGNRVKQQAWRDRHAAE